MSLTLHWFLPTDGGSCDVVGGGHGAYAANSAGDRPPRVEHFGQIAAAAEALGFDAVLTPADVWCEDEWLTTACYVRTGTVRKHRELEVVSS
ncbi:hypothetical protein [Nocardia sp. CA-135398]|uniref:hypothetical protein n=1 Tax=Nocardia sp. CA-135398 TaxID=3239977 RepID=UPI003D9948ED